MITVYGIPNCDTVKKTMDYLKQHNIPFTFHNYKTEGITKLQLKNWSKQVGYELLLNKKSTTWKACTPEEQASAAKLGGAIELMAKANSLIKRPVIEKDGAVIAVGFKAEELLQKIQD